MAGAKPLASLTPTLLARKGGARPAIRTHQALADNADTADAANANAPVDMLEAEHVRISSTARARNKAGDKVVSLSTIRKVAPAAKPQSLRRQRDRLAERLSDAAKPGKDAKAKAAPRQTSAFTLRLDAERRLKLRLASVVANRSAQQLLIEALDSMLAALPEVAELATRAGKRH